MRYGYCFPLSDCCVVSSSSSFFSPPFPAFALFSGSRGRISRTVRSHVKDETSAGGSEYERETRSRGKKWLVNFSDCDELPLIESPGRRELSARYEFRQTDGRDGSRARANRNNSTSCRVREHYVFIPAERVETSGESNLISRSNRRSLREKFERRDRLVSIKVSHWVHISRIERIRKNAINAID